MHVIEELGNPWADGLSNGPYPATTFPSNNPKADWPKNPPFKFQPKGWRSTKKPRVA